MKFEIIFPFIVCIITYSKITYKSWAGNNTEQRVEADGFVTVKFIKEKFLHIVTYILYISLFH